METKNDDFPNNVTSQHPPTSVNPPAGLHTQNEMEISTKKKINQKRAIYILTIFGIILYGLGLFSITQYPNYAHRTYISENSLMPGAAEIEYAEKEYETALKFSTMLLKPNHIALNDSLTYVHFLADKLREELIGIEVYVHEFDLKVDNLLLDKTQTSKKGVNLYCILRAPKGQGTESIVLSTKFSSDYESESLLPQEVTGLGIGVSLLKYFQTRKWLAKDIVLIATDNQFKGIGISKWIETYFSSNALPRAGSIQAAINMEFAPTSYLDNLVIHAIGANGQLPNLDLINIVHRISLRTGLPENRLFIEESNDFWTSFIPPQLTTLINFMVKQALGVPTGDHGSFIMYHIDAITIDCKNVGPNQKISMLFYPRLIESVVRSLNNLIERLHQSFYYYLLTHISQYISIGEYMISLGLVLAGMLLMGVFGTLNMKNPLHAVSIVTTNHIVGGILFSLPFIIKTLSEDFQIIIDQNQMNLIFFTICAILIFFILLVHNWIDQMFSTIGTSDILTFKTAILIPSLLFVSTSSLINFSFSFFCSSFVVVPLLFLTTRISFSFIRWIQILIVILYSPFCLVWIISVYLEMNPITLFNQFIEEFIEYGNLFYPFLVLVQLPTTLSYLKFLTIKSDI